MPTLCVYLFAGVGEFKNEAKRNVKPDLHRNSPPLSTKLRNRFEYQHRTPQLFKHGVVARGFLVNPIHDFSFNFLKFHCP